MKALRRIGLGVLTALFLVSVALAAESELVGKWCTKDKKETLVFTAEGLVTSLAGSLGVQGKYHSEGDVLVMTFEGGGAPPPLKYNYKIEGDSLRLESVATKEVMELRRADKKK